jgi:transmembrane sensor
MMLDIPGIDADAARWAVRLSAGPIVPEEQAAMDAWLAADVRHQGALVRARAAWLDLDRLAALVPHERPAEREIVTPLIEPHLPWTRKRQWTRRRILAAGLAAAALTGTAGGWLWRRHGEVYESAIGEVLRVTLSDGSSLLLNTATRAVVHFDEHQRMVELTRGEGLFEVAKDPVRPFIVRVGGVLVRAVGTVFAVRAVDQDVDVMVTEGVVEVGDTTQTGTSAPQRVSADERAVVSAGQGIIVERIAAAEAERHLAWRDGMLSFDGETLGEAVKEINRHNTRQISIDDPVLAARPVVGLFRASDTTDFAEAVAAALGAESSSDGDEIHLRPRAAR